MTVDLYAPAPGLRLAITGAPAARAHFRAEYDAATATDGSSPDLLVDVRFARRLPAGLPRDGHKTVRWAVEAGAPDGHPLRVRVVVAGRPRRFALSMVQGYVVEPLASVVASRRGLVLLPAAALVEGPGAVVVLGRSRSGKTSVVARALAAGRDALGDDQVLLDPAGQVRSWPRRLRVYSDLPLTAPGAVAAMSPRDRRTLHVMRWVRRASRGLVAPSLPLTYAAVGGSVAPGPLPVARLVVVERSGSGDALVTDVLPPSAVLSVARAVLAEQRARLCRLLGPVWEQAVARAAAAEQETLAQALGHVAAEHVTVPASWDAPRAVAALEVALRVRSA